VTSDQRVTAGDKILNIIIINSILFQFAINIVFVAKICNAITIVMMFAGLADSLSQIDMSSFTTLSQTVNYG